MKRLLYISTAKIEVNDAQLREILDKSRRNNVASDITGLLVFGGRRFLQVLEGPVAAVDQTFDRIGVDRRHSALVKLHDKEIISRSFPGWAMRFELGAAHAENGTLKHQIEAMVSPIEDATLRAYFTGFVDTHAASQGKASRLLPLTRVSTH